MSKRAIVILGIVVILLSGLFGCTDKTSVPETQPTTAPETSPTMTPEPSPTPTPPEEEDLTDLDMDGVPDEYEVAGFVWKDGKFQKWDGNPDVSYYRTDPTQFSTDQDPYGDGMEVSGIKMDTSVVAPGNHPLVPAYPDIYVSMTSYDVTTKGEITNSTGGETQDAWSNSVSDEKTMEHNWQVTASVGTTIGVASSTTVSVSASVGGKYGSSHSVTRSTSGFSSKDWQEAMTMNPSEAAELKLRLKFENYGTAVGENVIPTVSLMLGNKTIITYQLPEDKKINALPVDGTFPESSDWVIGDEADNKIIVTLDELKSVQMGAPLFLDVPQMQADVMERDENGQWQVVSTWAKYKTRVDSVCARLSIDLRDGNMKSYRVFAKSQYGPDITLRDALSWTVGYNNTEQGPEIMGSSVGNWRFGFSSDAIEEVTRQLDGEADNNLLNVVLDAGWDISIMAPSGEDTPEIIWCHATEELDAIKVTACVIDDYAVSKVLFKTAPEAVGQEMEYEWEGTGIYHLELPADYSVTGTEIIEAINDRGNSATKPVNIPKRIPIEFTDGVYVITSVNSNKALDIYGPAPVVGSNVIQNNYSGNETQQWWLEYIDNGYYQIKDYRDGMCLEVVESKTNDNANVQLNTWNDTDNQKWTLEPTGDGSYKIIAKHSGKFLDIYESSTTNEASAVQNTKKENNSQKWIIQLVDSYPAIMPTRDTAEECFIILSKGHNTCLDVDGASADSGADVQHFEWWGGDNQRWQLSPVGNKYFMISAKHSGLCLTVENNNLVQQPYLGLDSQKWLIKRHEAIESNPGDFYYELESKESGLCLASKDGGALIQQNYIGEANQEWQLKPAEQSWLNNLTVTHGKNSRPSGEGWVQKGGDLNAGAGGDYIYLWVRGPVVDNLTVTHGKNSKPSGEGWIQKGGDLNAGAGGDYIYLWVRGPAVDNITVTHGKNSKPSGEGWTQKGGDLNAGAGGDYIYLWIR